jgi:hypothetical protein
VGTTPQNRGRYPDWDVMAQADHWDALTRGVIEDRVNQVPPIRFFSEREAATLGAFCDTVMAQDSDPRIPVLAMVDRKLHDGELDGFQFDDMPDDRDTWRIVARGLDQEARARGCPDFAAATAEVKQSICERFDRGEVSGGAWDELNVSRAWSVLMRHVTQAFYSHPWSWNEIGFGGPAYPRGYARFGIGQREWWEGEERPG